MKIDFSGQVAVVAGGTGGLGKAVSLAFLAEGAKVVVTYRDQKEFSALQDLAGSHQSSLEGVLVDVTDEAAAKQLIERVLERQGRVDALVNAVGGYAGGVKLWEMETNVFDRMLALNLRSGYALARAVLPSMLAAGRGSIVNVSAKAALDHGAGAGAYAASKAAALALMGLARRRYQRHRRARELRSAQHHRHRRESAGHAELPISHRGRKPEDIARVILFLSSDAAKVVHGAASFRCSREIAKQQHSDRCRAFNAVFLLSRLRGILNDWCRRRDSEPLLPLRVHGPEPCASANSATSALLACREPDGWTQQP